MRQDMNSGGQDGGGMGQEDRPGLPEAIDRLENAAAAELKRFSAASRSAHQAQEFPEWAMDAIRICRYVRTVAAIPDQDQAHQEPPR